MTAFPSLPLFTDAYIADTAHLTCEEHGAYLRLLIFAWRSPGCRLPDDDGRLARMLGLTPKRWASLKVGVMAFWSMDGGFWVQKRLAREHQFVTEKVEKKRAAGQQGGRPKSLPDNETPKAYGSENRKQNESERKAPTPTPTKTPVVPKGTDEAFERFRAAYPKRNVAFPTTSARKRYDEAIRKGATADQIEAGAKAYAAEQQRIGKVGTEFVKTADVWLNQGRWRDYGSRAEAATQSTDYLATLSDDRWREEVRRWKSTVGHWPLAQRTPAPDSPKTKVPRHILDEFDIRPRDISEMFGLARTAA